MCHPQPKPSPVPRDLHLKLREKKKKSLRESKSYLLCFSPTLQLQVLQGVWDRSPSAVSHTLGPPVSSGRWDRAAFGACVLAMGSPLDVTMTAGARRGGNLLFPPPKGKLFPRTSSDRGCARAAVLSLRSLSPVFRRTTLSTSPHLSFPNVWSACCSSQVSPIIRSTCCSTFNASLCPNVYFFY